jgi:hypothetical protein
MPGDGVSLPTTLAQMGNVAKTQARGQQSSPQVTPFSEQKDSKDEIRIQRVKETMEAEKNRVTRQDEEKDKRKRRRLRRSRKKDHDQMGLGLDESVNPDATNRDESQGELDEEKLGSLIDLRV